MHDMVSDPDADRKQPAPSSEPDKTPAIGMSVSHQVAEDRNVVFQSHVAADCATEELNAFLDKVFIASERQKARVSLPALRKRLQHLQKVHVRVAEDLFRLDSEAQNARDAMIAAHLAAGRRGEPKLSAAQQGHKQKNDADRLNARTSYERHQEDIDDLKKEIAELEMSIKEA